METISHTITINKPPSEVYEAFSSLGGIRSWWTNAVSGNPDKGGELTFQLGDDTHVVFTVTSLKKNACMVLTPLSANFPGGTEMLGTIITFMVNTNAAHNTNLSFTHEGWKATSPFYKSVATQWATRLESLKKVCEDGKGEPEIVQIRRK
jgi:uncharacterized protein YndB with AHSA1/START domain